MTTLDTGKLIFRSLEIDGRASISGDLTNEHAAGIYAYEFTDGMWYVGKSTNVRTRHTKHMQEYRHEDPPRIPRQRVAAPIRKMRMPRRTQKAFGQISRPYLTKCKIVNVIFASAGVLGGFWLVFSQVAKRAPKSQRFDGSPCAL